MKDLSQHFDKIAGMVPRVRDLSMNSFEYKLLALITANYPTETDELATVCYSLIANMWSVILAATLDTKITTEAMQEICDKFIKEASANTDLALARKDAGDWLSQIFKGEI